MSELVPTDEIETIVGATRHRTLHRAHAVSAEQTVYVLHSHDCKDTHADLRDCEFSLALDRGIDTDRWRGYEDRPVNVRISDDHRLIPVRVLPARTWLR